MEESSPLSPLAPRRRFQSPCRVPIEFRRYQTFSRRRSIHRSRLYCLRFFGGRTAEGSRREIRSYDENVSPFRSSPREGPSPHPWLRRSNGRFDKRRLQGPSGKCKSSSWISLWGQLCVARALPRHPHRARLHDEPGVILTLAGRRQRGGIVHHRHVGSGQPRMILSKMNPVVVFPSSSSPTSQSFVSITS